MNSDGKSTWYSEEVLPTLSQRRSRLLLVTKWCWPYGGGEEFFHESTVFLSTSWDWIGWISFSDAHNMTHEKFKIHSISHMGRQIQHIYLPGGYSHKLLVQWLRLLLPNCVHQQGPLRSEIVSACHQVNVPIVCGYHFWNGLAQLNGENRNQDIIQHIDEHRIDGEFKELLATKLDVGYVASDFMNRVLEAFGESTKLDVVQPVPLAFLKQKPFPLDDENLFGNLFVEKRPIDVLFINMDRGKGGALFGSLRVNFGETGRLLGIVSETLDPSPRNKEWVNTIVTNLGYTAEDLFERHLFTTTDQFLTSAQHHGLMKRTNEITKVLEQTATLVVPSLVDETFCRVVLDAMGCDCAVVCSRQGNLFDLCKGPDQETLSITRPPDTPENIRVWVDRIMEIVSLPQVYNQQLEATQRQRRLLYEKYEHSLLNLNVLFCKAQSRRRRRVGFVCPWADQGLGIQTRSYVRMLLEECGVEISVFSYLPYYAESSKHILQKNPEEWDLCHVYYSQHNREKIPDEEFVEWLNDQAIWMVFIPETVNQRVFELAELATRRSIVAVAIPNIEIVKRQEVRWHRKFDVVLGNSVFCLEQLKAANLPLVHYRSATNTPLRQPIGFYMGYSLPPNENSCKHGEDANRIRMLLLGGMNAFHRKRVDQVLEVYSQLDRESRKRLHLTVTIQHKLDELQQEFLDQVRIQVNDKDCLEILTGGLTYQRVCQLYEQSDCVIQISKQEGLGLGFFEAISRGLPVITLDVPPHNEIIRHNISGILLPSKFADTMTDNPDALYGSTELVSSDLAQLFENLASGVQLLPTRAREDFDRRYGYPQYVKRWKKLFRVAAGLYR